MDLNDGLYSSLKAHLDWGKPRLECFVGMLLGLLRLKQVNLTQLAVGFWVHPNKGTKSPTGNSALA